MYKKPKTGYTIINRSGKHRFGYNVGFFEREYLRSSPLSMRLRFPRRSLFPCFYVFLDWSDRFQYDTLQRRFDLAVRGSDYEEKSNICLFI